METKNSNLKDPLEELPVEIVSHSLSFLPPRSIATASAISRQWRMNVNGNPALHREVDLSNLGGGKNAAILHHFTRFSFLSSHTLVKVSLNLTSFWDDWHASSDQDVVHLDSLLMMLIQSRATLREASFRFSRGEDERLADGNPFQFLLRLIIELQVFKAIQRITIDAPLPLAFKAGRQKQFSLTNSIKDYSPIETHEVSKIMKEASHLVEGGLTELCLLDEVGEESEKDQVVGELQDSSLNTIQHLDLYFRRSTNDRELWINALSFTNLISLRLYLWGSEEEEILLEVPKVVPTSKLISLDLSLEQWEVDWKSLGHWIGHSLESFTLDLDDRGSRAIEQLFQRTSHSVNFNSRETLRILNLKHISYESSTEIESEADLFFPSLEEVSFYHLNTPAFDFFSRLTSPKLRFLSIISKANQLGDFDPLINILKSHASKLVELHLKWEIDDSILTTSDYLVFKRHPLEFERLEKLVIRNLPSRGTLDALGLEESQYPSLVQLSFLPYQESPLTYHYNEANRSMRALFSENAPRLVVGRF